MKQSAMICYLFICVAVMTAACDDKEPVLRGSGTATIIMQKAELFADDIVTIRVTVTGEGISPPIVQYLSKDFDGEWSGTISDIPAGTNRNFLAEALDVNDESIYSGVVVVPNITPGGSVSIIIPLFARMPSPTVENAVPIISALLISPSSIACGEEAVMRVVAHDVDGNETLTYEWLGIESEFLTPNSPESVWKAPEQPGNYGISAFVTDPEGASASVSAIITVTEQTGAVDIRIAIETPPVITELVPLPTRVDVGESTQLNLTAYNPNGQSVSYDWFTDCDGYFNDDQIEDPTFTLQGITGDTCEIEVLVWGLVPNHASITIQTGPPVTPTGPPPGCGDELLFVDAGLEMAVRDAVQIPSGPIYYTDIIGLTSLDASNRGITDLSGIECLNVLTSLGVHENNLTDISPLAQLTHLSSLAIFSNSISDLSPLISLKYLNGITAHNNEISDITPLSSLPNLKDISLFGNDVVNISPLSGLSRLESLMLMGNDIEDISAVANLHSLRYLAIMDNRVTDLSPLVNLTQLQTLYAFGNEIQDISPLGICQWISSGDIIAVSDNPVNCSDPDTIATIQALELKDIDFSHDCSSTP